MKCISNVVFISESADDEETSNICLDHQSSLLEGTVRCNLLILRIQFSVCAVIIFSTVAEVRANKDLLLIQALRILLLKITIFNILMTAQAVIKW